MLLLAPFVFKLVDYSKMANCRNTNILQRLSVSQTIGLFGHKSHQKKSKDVGSDILLQFFQKYYFVHELWTLKDSFRTWKGVFFGWKCAK